MRNIKNINPQVACIYAIVQRHDKHLTNKY